MLSLLDTFLQFSDLSCIVHYWAQSRIVILKSSTQRCHCVSISLPLNSMPLSLGETMRGRIGRLSLILASCLWGLVVPLDHYIPVLSKRIYPTGMTKTLSGPKHAAQWEPELLCPMREGGLSHLGFVWVANPTSVSQVNITTHSRRHAKMSHRLLCLMPLQWRDWNREHGIVLQGVGTD